jgi:hypothetical protein
MFWWLWAFVVALLPLLFILSRNYNIFLCVSSGPWAYNCWVKWLLFPIYWLAVNFAIPLFCSVAFYMQLNTLENLCILYMAGCSFFNCAYVSIFLFAAFPCYWPSEPFNGTSQETVNILAAPQATKRGLRSISFLIELLNKWVIYQHSPIIILFWYAGSGWGWFRNEPKWR